MYLLHTSHAPRGNQLLLTRLACLNKVLFIYLSKAMRKSRKKRHIIPENIRMQDRSDVRSDGPED